MKPDKQAHSVKTTIGDYRRQIPVFLFKVTPNGVSKKTKSSVQYLCIQSLFLCIPCWLLVNKTWQTESVQTIWNWSIFLPKTTDPLGLSWAACQCGCWTLCIQRPLRGRQVAHHHYQHLTVINGCNSSLGLRRLRLTAYLTVSLDTSSPVNGCWYQLPESCGRDLKGLPSRRENVRVGVFNGGETSMWE